MRSGLLAEFDTPDALERAYADLEREGYTRLESWTPFPLKALLRRQGRSGIPRVMFWAGMLGGAFGYFVQWWCNAHDFPIDVGGRPPDSVPAFIPITFESAVLAAAVVGFFVLLGHCGLPRLVHPVFEVDGFERASVDRFWMGIDASDPRFDDALRDRLAALGALRCVPLGVMP
jgi:hypothetical protein